MSLQAFVLGVSGISGSGKTFFIQRLKEKLGDKVAVVSFDDYYKPKHEQAKDENGNINFDLPSALYHERFQADLLNLIQGHPALIKKYHFENADAPETTEVIYPAPVIIAEGLFIFDFPEIDGLLSSRMYVETDMALSLQRRLERDDKERGIPKDRSLYQWNNHVLPAWEKYIQPHVSRCNLVIKNDGPHDQNLGLIIQHILKSAHPEIVKEIASFVL
jgi:uridine kinase